MFTYNQTVDFTKLPKYIQQAGKPFPIVFERRTSSLPATKYKSIMTGIFQGDKLIAAYFMYKGRIADKFAPAPPWMSLSHPKIRMATDKDFQNAVDNTMTIRQLYGNEDKRERRRRNYKAWFRRKQATMKAQQKAGYAYKNLQICWLDDYGYNIFRMYDEAG